MKFYFCAFFVEWFVVMLECGFNWIKNCFSVIFVSYEYNWIYWNTVSFLNVCFCVIVCESCVVWRDIIFVLIEVGFFCIWKYDSIWLLISLIFLWISSFSFSLLFFVALIFSYYILTHFDDFVNHSFLYYSC